MISRLKPNSLQKKYTITYLLGTFVLISALNCLCISAMDTQGIRQITTEIVVPEIVSIESKAEAISSKIDTLSPVNTPYAAPSNIKPLKDAAADFYKIPAQQPIQYGTTARTPLTAKTISQPGSYFLNENVTGNITITSNNVTLDLNGFTLTGQITTNNNTITIKNGTIINNGAALTITNSTNILIENIVVIITAATTSGIVFDTVNGAEIKECIVTSNRTISLGMFYFHTCRNISLTGCKAYYTGIPETPSGIGFLINSGNENTYATISLTGCLAKLLATGFSLDLSRNIILEQCIAQQCGEEGFSLETVTDIILDQCIATSNSGNGFYSKSDLNTGIIRGCTAKYPGGPNTFNEPGHGFKDYDVNSGNPSTIRYTANASYCISTNPAFTYGYYPTSGTPFWPQKQPQGVVSGLSYWNNIYVN